MTKIDNSVDILDITFQSEITAKQITKFVEDQYIKHRIYESDERYNQIPKSYIFRDEMNGQMIKAGKDQRGKYVVLSPLKDDLKGVEEFIKIEYCRDLLVRIKLLQQDLRKLSISARKKITTRNDLNKLIGEFNKLYSIDIMTLKGKKLGLFILEHFKVDMENNSDFNQMELMRNFKLKFNTNFSDTKIRNAIRTALGRK